MPGLLFWKDQIYLSPIFKASGLNQTDTDISVVLLGVAEAGTVAYCVPSLYAPLLNLASIKVIPTFVALYVVVI